MKNIIYLFILAFGLSALSCSDRLDVKPTLYQDTEEALSTQEGLTSLRNSSYAYTRWVYGRYFYHFAEMLANDTEITFVGTYEELSDLDNKSLVSTFYWGELAWRYSYRAINGCNLILDNLEVVEDEALKQQLEGDARFIRAILYFDMVRFFSLPYGANASTTPAIPLVQKGVVDPSGITYPSKASIGEIFSLVENDLQKASNLLVTDETFFANKSSAQAMLTRYYLTIEDYEMAATYADSVIESGNFELVTDPFYAFNQSVNSSEDILTWAQSELDNEDLGGNNGMAAFYASTNAVGRSEMVINEDFITSTFDTTDLRGIVQYGLTNHSEVQNLYYEGFGTRARGLYSSKWLEYNTNFTFCRLAEMYLTRAEANQMIIDDGGTAIGANTPLQDINMIRDRAGLDPAPSVVLQDIQFERYRELIFEGHRLHDFKRWKDDIAGLPWDSERLIIPIPKVETDANPALLDE